MSERKGYEPSDVRVSWVVFWTTVLAVALVVILIALAWMLKFLMKEQRQVEEAAPARVVERRSFPQPRLQRVPAEELALLRAREEVELNNYGWVNKEAGVVRIPIERAMELLVERGLPEPRREPQTPLELRQERAAEPQ
jgi:hypothetical protein